MVNLLKSGRLLQKQMHIEQPETEPVIAEINLNDVNSNKEMLAFASSVSARCHQFTLQFLKLLQYHQSNPMGAPNYIGLLTNTFKYNKKQTAQPVCAKILNGGNFAFKCWECQNQDNSIICIQCFNKSDHTGHNFQKIVVSGGCCDCGDDEKWKIQGSCTDHNKKDFQVEVDPKETEQFLKQMKYVLQLAFMFSFFAVVPNHKAHFAKYLQAYVQFLMKFNQKSMISNEMTFQLLKSTFGKHPAVMHAGKGYALKITVFSYLTRFYANKQFSALLVDLFILLFTRPEFKEYLTLEYCRLIQTKPVILNSEFANISCQIFTSHIMVSKLLNQNKLKPFNLHPETLKNEKFQLIADIYSRFFLDIGYFANLYNNVGKQFMEAYFEKTDVSELCGYEKFVRDDWESTVAYYGIQQIYFNRLVTIFQHVKQCKEANRKAMIDLVNYIKNRGDDTELNYYISQERTFILLLFILTDGDVESVAHNKQLLEQIGLDYKTLFKMLQSVMYVLRFYAVNLSNRQTVERYYTFYSFCLNKKARILPSLDMLIYKFCILAMSEYQTQIEGEYNTDMELGYEGPPNFKFDFLPQDLLALPSKFILFVLENIEETDDGAYDRKKALGFFTDYIGLLHESILSDQPELLLRNTYKLSQGLQQKFINFYGRLIKSVESIKYEQLKDVCKVFIGEDPAYLDKFLKECCVADNKRISLKKQKENQFSAVSLEYLKSFKCCEPLIPYSAQNYKKVGLQKIMSHPSSKTNFGLLKNLTFNTKFIVQVTKIVNKYLQSFKNHPNIIKFDGPTFEKFLQQLIKINYTIQNQAIVELLVKVNANKALFDSFSEDFKKMFLGIIGQASAIVDQKIFQSPKNEEKKLKMQQLKAKKLEKFKQKQTKTMEIYRKQSADLMKQESQQKSFLQPQCMFCKMSAESENLSMLCFTQKSNIFSTKYLGCEREVDFMTTCNHYAHQSCNKSVNGSREYIYCNFCKTSSNYLLLIQSASDMKPEKIEDSSEQNQEQNGQQNSSNIHNQMAQKLKHFKIKLAKLKKTKSLGSAKQILQDQDHQLSTQERQIQTVALLVLYGAIVDYEYFVRSLSKVCCFTLRNLINRKSITIDSLIESVRESKKKAELTEQQTIFWNAYNFTILSVSSLVSCKTELVSKQWNMKWLLQQIPPQLSQSVSMILGSIGQPEKLHLLEQTMLVPYHPMQLRKLPETLAELTGEMGHCPCCSRVTNEIVLCMICPFKSCVSCEVNNLTKHSSKVHASSSIFIRVDEGWPIYVTTNKNFVYNSLYLNFVGEPFTLFKGSKDKSEFKLDQQNYNKVKTDIMKHRIEQQIRYSELKLGKISQMVP